MTTERVPCPPGSALTGAATPAASASRSTGFAILRAPDARIASVIWAAERGPTAAMAPVGEVTTTVPSKASRSARVRTYACRVGEPDRAEDHGELHLPVLGVQPRGRVRQQALLGGGGAARARAG